LIELDFPKEAPIVLPQGGRSSEEYRIVKEALGCGDDDIVYIGGYIYHYYYYDYYYYYIGG